MTAPTTIITTTTTTTPAAAGADGGIHSDQASVLSRSTITTASNSNLASASSVREKARRRWEQNRTANQRMKWRQRAAKSASADRQRPHEKAAEEEHERMLVEKASRKLQEQARAEKERQLERGASDGTLPTVQQKEEQEEEEAEEEQTLNSREEEQEEAVVRALARQRQLKQRQQKRRLAQAKAPGADAPANAPPPASSISMKSSNDPEVSPKAVVTVATMKKKDPEMTTPPTLPSSAESSFASSSSSSSSHASSASVTDSASASVSASATSGSARNRVRVNTESSAASAASAATYTPSCGQHSLPPDHADASSSSSVDASTLPPPPPPPRRNKPNNITKKRFVTMSTKRSAHPSPFKFRQSAIKAAQREGVSPPITSSKAGEDGRHDRSGSSKHSSSTADVQESSTSSCNLDSKSHQSNLSLKGPQRRPVEPTSPPPPSPPSRPVAPRPDVSQQQRPKEQQMEENCRQAPPSSNSMPGTNTESGLGIQWKISEEGNGELSFEDLRSLSIDDLRTMFGDGSSPRESRARSPAGKSNRHDNTAIVDEANVRAVEEMNGTMKVEELAVPNKETEVEEDAGTRAACIAAEEARSHVDRSIHRWEKHSGCDPPDDDTSSRHNVKRRADPPAGDEFDNNGACNEEVNQDEAEAGGVTFLKVDPEPEQSKPLHAVGNADDNNAAVSNGLQNLHQITEIRARENTTTHGTVCSRSIVSELTYDDHLSVATGHISHFSMSPSELEEEAAEIEAMEEAARLTGHSLHHRILPCVKEESPSEASPDATLSLEQSPAPAAPIAARKKTKIADTTLNQLLKEAQDLTEMIDDTELDVTQDDTTREEDHSQITDTAILAEMKEIQASIDYTQSQLRDAQRDVDKQMEVETELLGELHELLRAFGVSDPLASRKIEDEARSALNAEEEARIALVRSERECQWIHEDSANKAETESNLRAELGDLRKQLAKVESKTQKEESILLKRVKLCEQEERNVQEEHNRLQKKLKEVTAHSIPADNRSGEMGIKSSSNDDKDSSTVGGLMNKSVVTEGGTSSQPFDELAGLSTELSMIIDEQVGVAMAVNENSISAMSEKEARATLQEMEARVTQFEQTIEQLEHAQGKMISPIAARQVPQPPSLPRVLSSPINGSTISIDRQNLEDAQIVQSSSPLKEEDEKLPPKEEEAASQVPQKKPDEGDCSNAISCHGEATAELTLSKEKEMNATKDTSFTMSDAVTDMNLKQYFVPGTPKRLAKKVWRTSPKRKAFGTPKRALGLTSSVIEINANVGDQDTVSSIGSRDVARVSPDTPQRFKCHQNCGLMDSINNFWGKEGIPEGDEEQSEK